MQPNDRSAADDHVTSTDRRDALAMSAILASEPELYVDVTGVPRITLPLAPTSEARMPWSLRHARVRAEIAELVFHKRGLILFEHEIRRILCVLEGKAWREQRYDLDTVQALDAEPLVEALYIYLHQPEVNGRFSGTCTKLLSDLKKVAVKNGVDIACDAWPKGPARLSFRIGELTKLLEKFKITAKRGRANGGAKCVLIKSPFRRDAGAKAASQPATSDNSHYPKDLRVRGGGDDGSKLLDRIAKKEGGTQE
jgi:hypothetical protein